MSGNLRDALLASADPTAGRRRLDLMEAGLVRRNGKVRRIVGRMDLPGAAASRETLRQQGLKSMKQFGREKS